MSKSLFDKEMMEEIRMAGVIIMEAIKQGFK